MEYPFGMYDAKEVRFVKNEYPGICRFWREPYFSSVGQEADRDMEYFSRIYPQQTRTLKRLVEEECDRMDYDGSPMYDEYPDKIMVYGMCRRIRERAGKEGLLEEELWAEAVPEGRQTKGLSWADQVIFVLLAQEMHQRRRRKRNERRWF